MSSEQIDGTWVNVGSILGLTVIIILDVVAHCPASGVNVYVVVAVLSNPGDQVPVIPLLAVVGNTLKVSPEQMSAT